MQLRNVVDVFVFENSFVAAQKDVHNIPIQKI